MVDAEIGAKLGELMLPRGRALDLWADTSLDRALLNLLASQPACRQATSGWGTCGTFS